jgi:hypothetical protein
MNSRDITHLHLEGGVILLALLFNVPKDGACFFHCLVLFFGKYYADNDDELPPFFRDSQVLRIYVCARLSEMMDVPITGLGQTARSYIETEYLGIARNRKCLHSSFWNKQIAEAGHDPSKVKLYVDTFEDYVSWMAHENTQVDALIVAFTAQLFELNLSVLTRSVSEVLESSENGNVQILIEMGFSKHDAEKALADANDNLDGAIENLSQRKQNLDSGDEPKIWREQPYVNLSNINIYLVNDEAHFQLLEVLDDVRLKFVQFPFPSGGAEAQQFHDDYLPNDNEDFSQLLAQVANDTVVQNQRQMSSEAFVFEHQQWMSSEAAFFEHAHQMISEDEFIELCDSQLSHLTVLHQFSDVDVVLTKDNLVSLMKFLSKRFMIPSLGLNYRIVCFYMNDGSNVAYQCSSKHDFSRREKKMAFFDELFSNISGKFVTSVKLERL